MRPSLALAGLVVAAFSWHVVAQPQEPCQPERVRKATPQPGAALGAQSCSGSACHGRESKDTAGPIGRNEFRLWAMWDPHAYAYEVLKTQRAQAMLPALTPPSQFKEATDEPRCLVCHTDQALLAKKATPTATHGVACEACHGPSEKWLDSHHASNRPSREELTRQGLRDPCDLIALGGACVGCHVGAKPAAGRPAQEVTHDLLAAGHPRLNFELTVYLANLPPHWDTAARARAQGADFEARAWAAGQVEAARSSLGLLAHQATRVASWPDFSAHDCESCHSPPVSSGAKSGRRLPMSRWTTALLGDVGHLVGVEKKAGAAVDRALEELRGAVEESPRDAGAVAKKAIALENVLGSWDQAIRTWKPDPVLALKRMAALEKGADWNWEAATQRYLALSALQRTRRFESKPEPESGVEDALARLATQLALPANGGRRDYSPSRIAPLFDNVRRRIK